jgi:hypothetical protein
LKLSAGNTKKPKPQIPTTAKSRWLLMMMTEKRRKYEKRERKI